MRVAEPPPVVVFAPSLILTVTIESGSGGAPELHLHAGGQGLWVARMAASLGAQVTLCTALGGESGHVLAGLLAGEEIDLVSVTSMGSNGSYVHDRRSGERTPIVEIAGAALSRHELDDLYGKTLLAALRSGTLILAGPQDRTIAGAIYARLAKDARENDVAVIADLTGEPLAGALAGGVTLLKISDKELQGEGFPPTKEQLVGQLRAIARLHERGARNVILSRGQAGALALVDGQLHEITGPRLTAADRHGTGDSMTAAAAVGIAQGLAPHDWLTLATSAGTLNATRHGLGTGTRAEIEQLRDLIQIHTLPHTMRDI
jgi:1-phosphofructokinase